MSCPGYAIRSGSNTNLARSCGIGSWRRTLERWSCPDDSLESSVNTTRCVHSHTNYRRTKNEKTAEKM